MITEIILEKLYPEMEEATIGEWLKKEGEPVSEGESLVEIITDKVAFELESEASGILRKITAPEKSVVPAGYVLGMIGEAEDELPDVSAHNQKLMELRAQALAEAKVPETAELPEAEKVPKAHPAKPVAGVRATPAARRIAREKGIDLAEITGSGPEGTITQKDVMEYWEQKSQGETKKS